MPQLDPSIFGGQLFWLAVTFVSLFLVLTFVILPRIGQTLSTRQNRMQDDLEAAERLRDQAQAALEAYDEALTAARANAVRLAQEVRAEMQAEMDKQKADIDARIAAQAAEAEKRLQASRDQAMSNIRSSAADIIGDIVTAVSGQTPDQAATDAALERALN
jgi:F-type H+-transporting ATPase subunit b